MNNEQEQPVAEEDATEAYKRVSVEGVTMSPLESRLVDEYAELRGLVLRINEKTMEERSLIATRIIDFERVMEKTSETSSDFKVEMLPQIERIKTDFEYSGKLQRVARRLERESTGGVLVPHVYEETIALCKEAKEKGVSSSIFEYTRPIIEEYLLKVRDAQRGIK